MISPEVNNLIFDLGGVILNLSPMHTYQKFSELTGLPLDDVVKICTSQKEFALFETGSISSDEFRSFIRNHMQVSCSNEAIDTAWNAMLLDFPAIRLETLKKLRGRFNLYLLSNTNAIHLKAFNEILMRTFQINSLDDFFDRTYYSHEIGMRKPNHDIYEFVLNDNSLQSKETLFFDDTLPNLKGASEVGLHTFHVTNANELFKGLVAHT